MPEKPTKQARAAQIGTSIAVLRNWERLGVDVFDDEAVRAHLRSIRKMPAKIKPEFMPKAVTRAVGDVADIDLDQFKLDLANAPDNNTARTLKTKIDGFLNLYKVEAAAGKYISRDKAGEEMVRVGAVFKAAVKRLEADLPPMLEGCSPEQMQRMIGDKCDEVLRGMVAEYKKLDEIEDE